MSTDTLIRHFSREWHDPQSDVRTALTWCDLDYEERELRAVHWKSGSLQELERLIRSAMQVLPIWNELDSWDQEGKVTLSLSWGEHGQRLHYHFSPISKWSSSWKRWEELRTRIEENNQGFYAFPEGSRADWIFPWVKYESPRSGRRMSAQWLEIEPPTQHEYMEASLILRGWLRDNAPDLLDDWF